jgi:uncharacterized membrane protein (DUF106 family)
MLWIKILARIALLVAIAVLILCGLKGFTLPRLAVIAASLLAGLLLSLIEYRRMQREEKERDRKFLKNFRKQLKLGNENHPEDIHHT